ncbi:retrovirus-related pol polyprotein from transposon TNT 1-94 [Tanacetum coccineum]
MDSGLAVPTFDQGEYLIDCINKAMAFLSAVVSRFPPSNNQLRTSSNPINQATIQDGRVTVQQCTQPKRPRSSAWFKEKLMLAEAQEAAFQTEDLDAYDLDCDDISSAKAVLMANLSSCDLDVLYEVPYSDTYQNDMINQDVQEMSYSEQTHIVDFPNNEITSDSNIIPYSRYLQESQDADKENKSNKMVNKSLTAELERYKERVAIFEQRQNVDLIKREQLIDSQTDDLIRNRNVKFATFQQEIDTLKETLSNQVKEKESKYIDKEIVLENQNKELENILCKLYRSTQAMHMLTKPQVFYDNTHKQALGYQNPFHLKKAQRIKPTLYDGSVIAKEQIFDTVVKKRTTPDVIMAGAWGFEHTKACFVTEIIPFLKVLKDTFNAFDRTLLDKITDVQTVFNQMEAAVDQCSIDKNAFEIQIKQISIDNDQLLKQTMSQEIVHIAMKSMDILNVNKSCVDECNKCLELETELLKKKDLIEKDVYDKLLKSYSTLEKHCITLELTTQLNQEVFQKDNFRENQNAPTFNQLFNINELKAESQEKDTVIRKLKDRIKSLRGKDNQSDSIRKTRVQFKEHCASLIAQINAKSVKKSNLNAQLQEKVFAIVALKNKLRKLKEKNVVDTAVSKPIATIAPGMFKLDIDTISHRLKNNRDAHEVYLEKTIPDTLRGLVDYARKQNPSEPLLESACMFTKHVQELLVYVSKTCLSSTKPCEKLVVVTPMNKDKKVRFVEPVTSSSNISKQIDSLRTKDSNKPLLTSTGVNTTTSDSGSKPSGNTKKNRTSQPPSRNKKNKVEEHPRKVKSSLNKTNSISEPISNAHVKHSVRNAKFKSICAICNKCLFDANHDMYVIDYVNDVNVRRTFTIVGNKCPYTRFTYTKVVPTKETTNKSVLTPTQGIIVYSRRPKAPKLVGSSSKSMITESRISNSSDPTQSGGSTISNVPSSSLNDCRSCPRTSKKDHLCSAYALGKRKKHSHKPKAEDSIQEKFYLMHMDLCGPMRIQSINGRKYILVIVDDYSRFTWVKFLRSKDKVPEFVIKFLKMIQVHLNATVHSIRTDNGTEFFNQTLRAYYEEVRISHQTSVARTPQQNGVVERRNRTLVEAARTMLIFLKAPLFLWAEAVATACYTQNRSLI